nr:general transcription factor 3C polypeptide 1 isoform X1 [Ciona intestinalis]|eukprot:XP_002125589.4 general transcription factor 3C polypeptide 1 isoform X1 [Ciona intestinalis]
MVDNRGRNKVVKGGKGSKRKSQEIKPKPPKIAKQIMKHVDAADLQAMSNRRGKQRVNFSLDEDSILLLCKVVATVLLKKTSASTRTTFGTATHWSLVRDVLLRNCSKSCDKTSTACSRRQRFIMKNKLTRICHDLSVAEVLADVDLVEKVLRGRVDLTDQEASACFMELLPLVKLKFKGGVHGTMEGVIPDSVDELNQSYAVQAFTTEPTDHDHEDGITNKDDVLKCSIENLIFAVLASDEKHFNQYQTYKIFEDYPEPLVSQVSELLKKRNIVSKKLENPHRKRNLPFAVPSYHITKLYWQSFRSQHFSQVFDDCISSINDLETQSPVTYKLDVNSGSIVSMLMSLLDDDLSLEINFPTELVMSDFKSIIGTDFYKSMKATEESMLADSHAKNDDPRKKKLMELFQMYQRHPSYSNWMMLSGVAGVVDEEKKILSHPEKLSLVPCIVEVQRPHRNQTKKHLFKYFEDKCVRYCDNGVQSCISKLLFSLRGPRFSRCDVIMIDGLDDITCFPENLRQLGKNMLEGLIDRHPSYKT